MNQKNVLLSLYSGEMKKIAAQRKYKVILLLSILVITGGALLSTITGNPLHFTMAYYPYTVLSLMNYTLTPLVIFMVISDIVAGEIENSQIKMILTRPISRFKILFAKAFAALSTVGIIFLFTLVISSIFSVVLGGISSFFPLKILFAYITALIPVITLTALAIFVATIAKSATSSYSFCVIIYLGCIALGFVFSNIAPMLFTSYMSISSLVIGTNIPFLNYVIGAAMLLGYALVLFSLGIVRFENKAF